VKAGQTVRVATYNIHRSKGLDGRVRPDRVARVLEEIGADIVALQEVVSLPAGGPEDDQARFLARATGTDFLFGENRKLWGGAYGNVVLSKLPMRTVKNHDISVRGRERRGVLHIDVELAPRTVLHVFNVHLGTAFLERRHQGRQLAGLEILLNQDLKGPRLVLGDFNEWAPGLTTRLLRAHLKSVDIHKHLRRRRTYPGVLPLLHLDHIYHDDVLELTALTLHRTRTALVASDHLPLVADFKLTTRSRDTRPIAHAPAPEPSRKRRG
jgi:endonuclease/exonuclease/phosphatase family metal-dependent hydrolase